MRLASLAAGLAALGLLLFALERAFPLRHPTRPLLSRLAVNALTSALALGTAALLVQPVARGMVGWVAAHRFGLVPALGIAGWWAVAVSFLLLDLSFYYWHRANHCLPLLWRFHNVHHLDPDLDVTTALRFHFGEVAFSAGFRALQVAVIGPTALAYAVYEVAFQAGVLVQHSNLRLPFPLERALSLAIVTPRMHGIHHSQVEAETNSNYSTVFSWWDRLHRSLRLNVPQAEIVIGVPAYSSPQDNRFAAVLMAPIRRQRDYWRGVPPREARNSRAVLAH